MLCKAQTGYNFPSCMPTDESVWPTVENSRFAVIQVRDRTEAAPNGDERAILAISRIVEQSAFVSQHPGIRKDLTGSNLWPVRSDCISMLPISTNVQTRSAPKRRGVGLRARSGVDAAQPPGCTREAEWPPALRP